MRRRRGVDLGPKVDLHCHSVASDGLVEAEELARAAAGAGLSALAITDHDLPPVLGHGERSYGDRSIRLIAGVELSTMHKERELHLLVYFSEAMPADFAEWCRARARWRAAWFDECAQALGMPEVQADAEAHAGRRTLTRLHLARAVVEHGLSPNLRSAFNDHVGHNSSVIPALNLSFMEALQVAKAAGGWTSWAHPPTALADDWAAEFAEAGLDALESHRPGKTGRNRLATLAHQNGMGITGGSDWHGWGKRKMGSFRVAARTLHKTDVALGLLA
jgi:predicted metal-dependent phosphoesterase TrpH